MRLWLVSQQEAIVERALLETADIVAATKLVFSPPEVSDMLILLEAFCLDIVQDDVD